MSLFGSTTDHRLNCLLTALHIATRYLIRSGPSAFVVQYCPALCPYRSYPQHSVLGMREMSLCFVLGCGALISSVVSSEVALRSDRSVVANLKNMEANSRLFSVRSRSYIHDRFQPVQLDSEYHCQRGPTTPSRSRIHLYHVQDISQMSLVALILPRIRVLDLHSSLCLNMEKFQNAHLATWNSAGGDVCAAFLGASLTEKNASVFAAD